MNRHALSVLEFEEAVRAVASRAGSDLGREAVLALRPLGDVAAVGRELARVAETTAYQRARPDWAPPVAPDARAPLRVLGVEGGVLEPGGLLLVRRLLEAAQALHEALGPGELEAEALARAVSELDPEDPERPFPHLGELRSRLPLLPRLLERIEEIVDPEGEVRDRASPELRGIRRRLRSARSRIVQKLERYLATLSDRIRVEDASVSVRDGRYVVPIRREGKSEVGGVIHGESATGATLFVEPPLALRLMNEVRELERGEEREVRRILREVTGRLRPERDGLTDGLDALVDFDSLWARALAARAWEGTVPELASAGQGSLRIVGGRHPLLLEAGEGPVVPFDLELAPDERALVVSGPNTGGKTVLLKAIGLLHLLTQSGIVPPVRPGTRLPLLRDLFADIGDEQSISESLSTFSAHLQNTLEILEGAGPGTLVLVDEMGTGTDPSEGAALARAILETLVEGGARAVVTSHLGELKRLDTEGSGIVNASLLFDPDRIEPTYRLRKGRPGRSYGLAIARRLGLPADVLDRAHTHLDSGELDVERLLETLEARETELREALREAEGARQRARALEEESRRREAELEARERTAEARAREDARRHLLEAREEVEEAIRELRETGAEERADVEREARRRVEDAARRHRERAPDRPQRKEGGRQPALDPGIRVRVRGSGTKGTVRQIREGRVTVEVGGLRVELPASEVERLQEAQEDGAPKASKRVAPGGWTGPDVEARPEADLRGLRVDEVELELGRALDGAVMGSLDELRIIHGKGTGAVKARVHELLRDDHRVSGFRGGRPGEGGGGVTVATIG